MSDFATRRRTMVDTQVRPSDVTKFPIINAMLQTRREVFLPARLAEAAYIGEELDLGHGRVVLEARDFAKLLDALDIQPTDLVLDIGSAYGYSAAVLSQMAEMVIAVEEDAEFAADAQAALTAEGYMNVSVHQGPLAEGAAAHGPYDAIIIQGGVGALPAGLTEQLAEDGRIGMIEQSAGQAAAWVGYKRNGNIDWRRVFNAGATVLPGFQKLHNFAL